MRVRGFEHGRAACGDEPSRTFDVEHGGGDKRGVLAEAVARVRDHRFRVVVGDQEVRQHDHLERERRDLGAVGALQGLVVGVEKQGREVVPRDFGDAIDRRPRFDLLPRCAHAGAL